MDVQYVLSVWVDICKQKNHLTGCWTVSHALCDGHPHVCCLQTCEKQRLKQISKSDKATLSFVFYMKADRSRQRKFESALHLGWFIQIVNTDFVEMGTLDGGTEDHSFLFIIQKWRRVTFRSDVFSVVSQVSLTLKTLSRIWGEVFCLSHMAHRVKFCYCRSA